MTRVIKASLAAGLVATAAMTLGQTLAPASRDGRHRAEAGGAVRHASESLAPLDYWADHLFDAH